MKYFSIQYEYSSTSNCFSYSLELNGIVSMQSINNSVHSNKHASITKITCQQYIIASNWILRFR